LARRPYFKPAETDTEKIKLLGVEPYQLNIFKIATHAATTTARKFIGLPAAVFTGGKLDPIMRELAIAAGCYMMVSIFLNTFEVDIEERNALL
jgi:hypothetical protein